MALDCHAGLLGAVPGEGKRDAGRAIRARTFELQPRIAAEIDEKPAPSGTRWTEYLDWIRYYREIGRNFTLVNNLYPMGHFPPLPPLAILDPICICVTGNLPSTMHLAIVQQDSKYRKSLEDNLEAAGHRVHGFSTGSALKNIDAGETLALVMVEWEQLGATAQPLFDWIRSRFGAGVTIIALSAWPKDADIIAALQAGADDHLSKSVAPAVLRARVDAIGRRAQPAERGSDSSERFGDFLFEIPASQVSYRGEAITVTAKEFTLALTLFRNLGRPLSRAALLESLWGRDPDRPTRTLDSHMSKLRAKLGLRPERGFRLTPIYGFGYRLDPGGAPPADAATRDVTESR